MKVLIITMSCGEGHNQIAKALKRSLDEKGATSDIIQLYGFDEKRVISKNKTYLNVTKYIPHIYERIWFHTRKKPLKSYIKGVIKDCQNYVLSQIDGYNPDAIVCTHNEAGAVVAHLKQTGKMDGRIITYGVVFDYCLCPYWEYNAGIDFLAYPDENMLGEMLSRGLKKERLLPFGLPVDEKYTVREDKEKVREELGLDKDKFTVVIYSGGNCVSSAYAIIKKLLKCKTDIHIVAVCGRNAKEYKKVQKLIENKSLKNVTNYGFCTCLDKLYSACDLSVTRGGGMGVTEQINKHIPFVLREKLIIQERLNAEFFERLGLGVRMKKLSDATKIVDNLANDGKKLAAMREKAVAFSKPNACVRLINHIIGNEKL